MNRDGVAVAGSLAVRECLLPEFFPVKLIGAFISVDFVVGCRFGCSFCISRRHAAREALFEAGVAFDTGVSARQMLGWLESMPSYRAGVQVRLGHDTDAGLEFEKSAALLELIGPTHSVVYLTRKPFTAHERTFFSLLRPGLLLKLTATPRSAALGVTRDPLKLIESATGLGAAQLHWVVGPLTTDNVAEAERVLAALPPGSRLTLKPLNTAGLPHLTAAPVSPTGLARLEALAWRLGHTVTEFFCRAGLAQVGRGFFDVDQLTGQPDADRRASDLRTCASCPQLASCHAPLDEPALLARLEAALPSIGLTLTAPPRRTGARAFQLEVAEPGSRGDETWLSHSLGQPVRIKLSTRERGISEGGSFCNVDAAVLGRWASTGFLPVAELRVAAARTLEALRLPRAPSPLELEEAW